MLPTMDLHSVLPNFADAVSIEDEYAVLKPSMVEENNLVLSLDDHEMDGGFLMIVDDVDDGPVSLGLLDEEDTNDVSFDALDALDEWSISESISLSDVVSPSTPTTDQEKTDYAHDVTPEGSVSDFDDFRIQTPDVEEVTVPFSAAVESFAESMRRSESTHRRLAKRKRSSIEDYVEKESKLFWSKHHKAVPFFTGNRPTLTPELEESRRKMWKLIRNVSVPRYEVSPQA